MSSEKQRASIVTEFKADSRRRQVVGYASTFGNVDLGGDVVLPGAYRKTLAEDLPAGRIKVKHNHERLIGMPVHAEEDSTGLLTISKIAPTDLGNETLILIEEGALDRMSIGYTAEEKRNTVRSGRSVRELVKIRLSEWSFLDVQPMNESARVVGLKARLPRELGGTKGSAEEAAELEWLRALSEAMRPKDPAAELRALIGEVSAYLRSKSRR
jgi:HK97 family phage prohead protease